MKKFSLIFISYLFFMVSCEKEQDKPENQINLNILEFSPCNTTKSANSQDYSIHIKSISNNYLEFTHQGSEFCCSTDSLGIYVKVSGDSIILNEVDKGPFSYCNCPHDLKFKIGTFRYGQYKIMIIESEHSYKRDTIRFDYHHAENADCTVFKKNL